MSRPEGTTEPSGVDPRRAAVWVLSVELGLRGSVAAQALAHLVLFAALSGLGSTPLLAASLLSDLVGLALRLGVRAWAYGPGLGRSRGPDLSIAVGAGVSFGLLGAFATPAIQFAWSAWVAQTNVGLLSTTLVATSAMQTLVSTVETVGVVALIVIGFVRSRPPIAK